MTSLDESAWSALLASVDDVPAPEEARLVVAKFLVLSSATSLAALDGVKAEDMLAARGAPTDFMAMGLLRRTVDVATAAGAARRMSASPSASAAGSGGVGALALANLIAPGAPKTTVDVATLLAQASLDGLVYQLQAESEIFVLLVEELAKAKAAVPPRSVVTFVDLTAKGCLPLWVPAESIGGRAAVSSDCEVLAGTSGTATLSQLGAALRGATAAPRFFRSMAQWCGAWMRFGTAAVAAGQWTLPQVIAHLDTVMQLSEQEKASGGTMFTALVYDELVRRSWEQRAFRRDSTLRIGEAVLEVNGPILAAARARLASTLSAAGVAETSPQSQAISASAGASELESTLAKQQAAMDAIARRAEQATKALQKGQQWQGDRQQGPKGKAKGSKNNGGKNPSLPPPPVPPADPAWGSKRRRR